MKKIGSIFLLLIILAGVLFLARNTLARVLIETGVKTVTGLPLKMGGLDLNFGNEFVKIDDLKLFNPAGFPDEAMVNIPEIYVAYDFAALLKGRAHLRELRFALDEFSVVRNEKGVLNLDTLKSLSKAPAPGNGAPAPAPSKSTPKPKVQIDLFNLKVGRVFFKDYTGGQPSVKTFHIDLNETYKDIQDPDALVRLIVARALMNTSIGMITNFDVAGLQSSVTGIAAGSLKTAQELAGKSLNELTSKAGVLKNSAMSGSLLKDAGGAGTEVVSEAGSAAKDAASLVTSKAAALTSGLAGKLKSLKKTQ